MKNPALNTPVIITLIGMSIMLISFVAGYALTVGHRSTLTWAVFDVSFYGGGLAVGSGFIWFNIVFLASLFSSTRKVK